MQTPGVGQRVEDFLEVAVTAWASPGAVAGLRDNSSAVLTGADSVERFWMVPTRCTPKMILHLAQLFSELPRVPVMNQYSAKIWQDWLLLLATRTLTGTDPQRGL